MEVEFHPFILSFCHHTTTRNWVYTFLRVRYVYNVLCNFSDRYIDNCCLTPSQPRRSYNQGDNFRDKDGDKILEGRRREVLHCQCHHQNDFGMAILLFYLLCWAKSGLKEENFIILQEKPALVLWFWWVN